MSIKHRKKNFLPYLVSLVNVKYNILNPIFVVIHLENLCRFYPKILQIQNICKINPLSYLLKMVKIVNWTFNILYPITQILD